MYNVDLTEKGKKQRTLDGILYDSRTEMLFVKEFINEKIKTKEIVKWERQIPYILQEGFIDFTGKKILPIKYIADFLIYWADGSQTVIDVKGMPDTTSKLKKKLYLYKYRDVDYRWYCRNLKFGGWLLYDDIEKLKRAEKKAKSNV